MMAIVQEQDKVLVPNEETSLAATLAAFAAGHEVPGSGSANALIASLAAAMTASVAAKTANHADEARYRPMSQTSETTARHARKLSVELLRLVDLDAQAFAPVVAIRREAKTLTDEYRQDQAARNEISALKPATEIPLQIAAMAIEVEKMAREMFEHGFKPARGESYSAMVAARTAADGALFVADFNIHRVTKKIDELNDPGYETPWLKRMRKRAEELKAQIRPAETAVRQTAHDLATAASPRLRKRKKRSQRPVGD